VLSALYLAPIMCLYKLSNASLGTMFLSHVDDGTIITQAPTIVDNLDTLRTSYAFIFDNFTKLGLASKHNKLELFYFNHVQAPTNLSLDLGYALYTRNTALTLKTY
jgi:hypothetical protein